MENLIEKIEPVHLEKRNIEKPKESIFLRFSNFRIAKIPTQPKFSDQVFFWYRTLLKESKPVIAEVFEFECRDESLVNWFFWTFWKATF